MIGERTYDYTKEHKELDFVEGKGVVCVHCEKLLEERDTLPDYGVFMGAVWVKQNLPCNPYEAPKATPDQAPKTSEQGVSDE